MPDIVCAIRGGPGSYHTRLAALRHAADHEVTVHFVSIVDPVAYEPLHEGEQQAIRAEMAWRDLALARATAARAGLDEVRFTVAVRDLAATITAYAGEVGADLILIGRPRPADDALLAGDGAEQFAADLRRRSDAAVSIVDPEHHQA